MNGGRASASIAGLNKQSTITALSFLDLSMCLVFFIFTISFILWTQRLAAKADEDTITIRDYSAKVTGLPGDVEADEVKRFFEGKWGAVVRIDLARPCHRAIQLLHKNAVRVTKEERVLARLQMATTKTAAAPTLAPDAAADLSSGPGSTNPQNRGVTAERDMMSKRTASDLEVLQR